MRSTWFAIVSLGLIASARAQQPPPQSRAEVMLEAHRGQTQYKLGDVIRLDLVFRDEAFPDLRAQVPAGRAYLPSAGELSVNASDYGDIADDVEITPSTGWFRWQGKSGHDYSMLAPLDATGIRIPVELNQGFVVREPGHYEIRVTTRRMGGKPVTTNAVAIDVAARSAEEEAALVESLDAQIAGSKGKARKEAAKELAYLPGDEAARAKVRWLLGSNREVADLMIGGLAATRNQRMQLDLLRAAWVDPAHAPDGTVQFALRRAEAFALGQMEPGWTMALASKRDDAAARTLEAEYAADLDRVIATLPRRSGDNRRDTAYALMQDNTLTPAQLARVKPAVLEEFARMEPMAQSMLIETRWDAVKDPSLAPALKAMIESNAPNTDAAAAVQRLIEIDEREARPYVVEMVCRTQRGLLLEKLNGVQEDRLPEVDACLTAMLAKGEPREHDFDWEQAAQRAARFATPAILPAVKKGWTNRSQDPSMLALLMRDAPPEAVALLDREPDLSWYPTAKVYEAVGGRFPPEILTWLRGPKAPLGAVAELSTFGEPQDRVLFERRLDDLRAQWRDRQAEMQDAQPNTPAYLAKSEEQELVSALLHAKAWTLTPAERQRLTDACVGDWCRRFAPRPEANP